MADFDLLRSAFKRLESDFERLEENVASALGRVSRLKREVQARTIETVTEAGTAAAVPSRQARSLSPFEERAEILRRSKGR